jgi:hypothetical protein
MRDGVGSRGITIVGDFVEFDAIDAAGLRLLVSLHTLAAIRHK